MVNIQGNDPRARAPDEFKLDFVRYPSSSSWKFICNYSVHIILKILLFSWTSCEAVGCIFLCVFADHYMLLCNICMNSIRRISDRGQLHFLLIGILENSSGIIPKLVKALLTIG